MALIGVGFGSLALTPNSADGIYLDNAYPMPSAGLDVVATNHYAWTCAEMEEYLSKENLFSF